MPSFRVNLQWATITEVIDNLFISGVTALKPHEIRALNIQMIVNCTSEVPNLKMADVDRIKLWVDDTDTSDISQHFDLVSDRIHAALLDGNRVLVHCVAGVSRSACICLAYLLKFQCKTLREAYWLMSAKRPMVRPNLGFWRQLISYEQLVKGNKASVRLVWASGSSQPPTADGTAPEPALIPDVYLPIVVPKRESVSPSPSTPDEKENNTAGLPIAPFIITTSEDSRERKASGAKPKFVPSLATLPEDHDAGMFYVQSNSSLTELELLSAETTSMSSSS